MLIVSPAGDKLTSADRPDADALRVISACRVTLPWTVTLSDLSLCNSPACHSQVHRISNAQVMRGWHWRQPMIKVRTQRWRGKEKRGQDVKGKREVWLAHLCVYYWVTHRGQSGADVRVRRCGSCLSVTFHSAVFTSYGNCTNYTLDRNSGIPSIQQDVNGLFLKGWVFFHPSVAESNQPLQWSQTRSQNKPVLQVFAQLVLLGDCTGCVWSCS